MKEGAMTVPKLVAIILAVVVLVFLIFGATQLKPLFEKVGVAFDNVLYFFNLKDDGGVRGGCTLLRILDWGAEGKLFLDNVGVLEGEQEGMFLMVCDDGTCGIDFPKGEFDYRIKGGKLEHFLDSGFGSYSGEDWFDLTEYSFMKSTADTKEDWEVYHGVLDLMEAELGEDSFGRNNFRKFYDERVTKSFWLYGNGEGFGDAYYAYWESGIWRFYHEKTPLNVETQPIVSVELAISKFYEVVHDDRPIIGNDDKVYYMERLPVLRDVEYFVSGGTPENLFDEYKKALDKSLKKGEITQKQYDIEIHSDWKPINFLIGGENYELDDTNERDRLAVEVEKIVDRLVEEAKMSEEEVAKLESAVVGKEVSAGEFVYVMALEMDSKGYPEIVLTNGTREYFLKFDNGVETLREIGDGIHLRHYPLKLTHNIQNRVQPREIDYKLPEAEWNKFYKLNLIKDFIKLKCYYY